MSFDPRKATAKVNEVLSDAINLAKEEQHAILTPIHLAVVLFEASDCPMGRPWPSANARARRRHLLALSPRSLKELFWVMGVVS